MRYLRHIGLASSLVIGGVVGGLMAPLSSEAVQPTITIKLDSGTAVSLLSAGSSSTCTTGTNSEAANGYTACYSILLGTQFTGTNSSNSTRTYTVAEISAGSARLKLADTAGQDKFSLVGVKFVPVVADWLDGSQTLNSDAATRPNEYEDHTITIVMNKTFDDDTTTGNGGNYVWSVRSAGQFITGPTGGTSGAKKCNFSGNTTTRVTDSKCDAVSDRVDFTGVGTFSPTKVNVPILSSTGTKNLSPLSFTATGPHLTPHLSYDGASNTTLGQVDPNYPSFDCTSNANGTSVVPGPSPVNTGPGNCRPTITLTMVAKLYGPDTLQVINGDDAFCAKCSERISTQDAGTIKFVQDGVKLLTAIETFKPKLKPLLQPIIDLGNLFLTSLTAPVDPNCPGTQVLALANSKVIVADALIVAQDPLNSPGIPAETGTITITKNTNDKASNTFTFNISGPSSLTETITLDRTKTASIVVPVVVGFYNIAEINNPEGWSFNNANCGGDGLTTGVQVLVGGNVNCTFNNNKAFSSYNYQRIDLTGLTWDAARALAQRLLPAGSWDLATINSAEEQTYIQTQTLLGAPTFSLPNFTDYWIGGEQQTGSCEPGGHWQWIKDEGEFWNALDGWCILGAISGKYQNWGTPTEPNNTNSSENNVTLDSRYGWRWNDLNKDGLVGYPKGYVAERVSP